MSGFEKGDIVMLKSGGPDMTIEKVGRYGTGMGGAGYDGAECVWFDGTKTIRDTFPVEALQKNP